MCAALVFRPNKQPKQKKQTTAIYDRQSQTNDWK